MNTKFKYLLLPMALLYRDSHNRLHFDMGFSNITQRAQGFHTCLHFRRSFL